MIDIKAEFKKHEDVYTKFKDIVNPKHPVPDLCAFLMLEEIAPASWSSGSGRCEIVAAAEHDQIWLATDIITFSKNATPEQVLDLRRCGVFYDSQVESLSMFV